MDPTSQDPLSADRKLEAFQPIRYRRVADEVVMALVDAVMGGLYSVGERLPRERDLAEQLGVSRTIVREAIGVLRRAGAVEVVRGRGTTVASSRELPHVMASLKGETHDALESLLEVRRALEVPATLLAGERATQDDFDHLERLVRDLPSLLDSPREFQILDFRFHLAIAEISQNPLLKELLDTVVGRLLRALFQLPVGRVDLSLALANQRATLEALLCRGHFEIIAAVDEHLAALEEQVLGTRLNKVDTVWAGWRTGGNPSSS